MEPGNNNSIGFPALPFSYCDQNGSSSPASGMDQLACNSNTINPSNISLSGYFPQNPTPTMQRPGFLPTSPVPPCKREKQRHQLQPLQQQKEHIQKCFAVPIPPKIRIEPVRDPFITALDTLLKLPSSPSVANAVSACVKLLIGCGNDKLSSENAVKALKSRIDGSISQELSRDKTIRILWIVGYVYSRGFSSQVGKLKEILKDHVVEMFVRLATKVSEQVHGEMRAIFSFWKRMMPPETIASILQIAGESISWLLAPDSRALAEVTGIQFYELQKNAGNASTNPGLSSLLDCKNGEKMGSKRSAAMADINCSPDGESKEEKEAVPKDVAQACSLASGPKRKRKPAKLITTSEPTYPESGTKDEVTNPRKRTAGVTEESKTAKPEMSKAERDELIAYLGLIPRYEATAADGRKRGYLPLKFTTDEFVTCILESQDWDFVKLGNGEYRVMFTQAP